ncbi:MAG: hypothetical protein KIT69_21650, partial [Propionibacteriaceae bacterium]|nr:hypothetical protein [Propionibacteriaceae bacterium]
TVQCDMVKEHLVAKAQDLANRLLKGLAQHARQKNVSISQQFEQILTQIKSHPKDAHELSALKDLVSRVENFEIVRLQEEISDMQAIMNLLEEFLYPVSNEDFTLSWNVVRYPQFIREALEDTKERIKQDSNIFETQLDQERDQLMRNLKKYQDEVENFVLYGLGTMQEMEECASKVEQLREKLVRAEKQVRSFNDRDILFGKEVREYAELKKLQDDFVPYDQLWSTMSDFHANHTVWLTGPFHELNAERVSDLVDKWYKLMYKLEKQFTSVSAVEPAKVAEDMRQKIQDFKRHVPVIRWLRTPGLRQRHWQEISKLLNYNLEPDSSLTLSHILSLPVHQHAEQLEEVCC